ncbi:MAG TPA: FimB/Mfa2 family fimbrial subunit [Candidatus Butyricimonas faecavium]|nr:FimB/Mfa2 family fimbrial subunit [Candidatus Butyricimonas faecavium]
MKRILYTLVVLSALLFVGCREDQLEGEDVGKEIALVFSSRSAGLSDEALGREVKDLHVLIFDEAGTFYQHKEYADLSSVSSVKLPLGTYTFAYLSNVDREQISGLTEGATLEDVILSLQSDENGETILPGSIFSGTDKITVGEDKTSDAELERMVGRLDINVSGLKKGMELQSVTLLGSPKAVRFDGTAEDTKARLKIPMNEDEEMMKGQAIAFPTCVDSLARLEFVLLVDGESQTYVSTLKNRVEANKIHTINAKINTSGDMFDVTIEMNVEEWGATESEDIMATPQIFVERLVVKLLMGATSVDFSKIKSVYMDFADDKDNTFTITGEKGNDYNGIEISGDTLVLVSYNRYECGQYLLRHLYLQDSLQNHLYELPNPIKNVIIDTTGNVMITLPKMADVADSDMKAMLELRDVLATAGLEVAKRWVGDNINLWSEVELDETGRVIQIGYSNLEDLDDDYMRVQNNKKTKNSVIKLSNRQTPVWSLPASFQNLTALKCFNISDDLWYGNLKEIPDFIKNMENLEELSVVMNGGTTIPELPVSLKYLEVESGSLTQLPSHIGNLTNLLYLSISAPYRQEEEYDYDYMPDLSQARLSSIDVDFSQLKNLKGLILVAGENCSLPTSLWSIPGNSLVELGLCGFSGIQVPSTISSWSSLSDLSLLNATMTPANIEAIKSLSLESLMIYSPVFGQNGLPDWLGGMASIRYLTLYDCGITSIPDSFNGLVNLHDLDMPKNPELTGHLPSVLLERYNNYDLSVYAPESNKFSPDGLPLVVTPTQILAEAEGSEHIIDVVTTAPWTCKLEGSDKFITVVPVEGNITSGDSLSGEGILAGIGNAKLKLKVKENLFGEWSHRYGYVVVRVSERNSVYVNVEQPGMSEERLAVSLGDTSLNSGDRFMLDVFSNTEWYISSDLVEGDGYLEMNNTEGRGNASLEGRIFVADSTSLCTYSIHLRSRYSGLEKNITVTATNAN